MDGFGISLMLMHENREILVVTVLSKGAKGLKASNPPLKRF